ncbi:MAG: ammonia-forming cytochrome c nitrite reductase subunit c552 [Anaerolineae bacterium]
MMHIVLNRPLLRIFFLAVSGFLLIFTGVLMLSDTTSVHAQTGESAEYIGSKECQSCHRSLAAKHYDTRHSLTLQKPKSDTILADFTLDEAIRQVKFPGEETPRAFTADDIAFVVGSGRNVQRYLYKLERDQYAVFPAEWNTAEEKWEPYSLASTWPDPAYDWTRNCAGCHTTGLNIDRGRWKDDAVQCEACHGPGSIHEETARDVGRNPNEEELAAIRSSIVLSSDARICGQCHSQGVSAEDGLPYPITYSPGQDLLASFTLSQPDDSAHWRGSGHARNQNMQFNEWLQSRHSQALASLKSSENADDTCLECHSADYQMNERLRTAQESGDREGGPVQPITLENAQYSVTCTSCHNPHGEGELDFQLTAEPYTLCASCHADNRLATVHNPVKEMFEGEPVIDQVTALPSKHFTEGVECSTCHMPLTLASGTTWHSGSHTMKPVLPAQAVDDQPDSCTGCHTDLSREYMQHFIDETQSKILGLLTDAQVAAGSRTENPAWVLNAIEFVSSDRSGGIHNFSYASNLLDAVALELGITQNAINPDVTTHPVEDPTECAECHKDEHRQWQTSKHANASLDETFLNEFTSQGRPSYCMSCHASGYDPRTENYAFEGVVCSSCHYVSGGAEHPPGPVEVASNSAVCGQCHAGAHAPTYNEWLVSSHSTAGIDCVDCHTPHNDGLILNDVNSTCASCHEDAITDTIHMSEDMNCVDCHMAKRVKEGTVFTVQSGHSMLIDPGVCSDCHGSIHLLSQGEANLTAQEQNALETLKSQVGDLQTASVENLNTGIVGGALGTLVMFVVAFVVIRLGRRNR